jgi:hypothetical protein
MVEDATTTSLHLLHRRGCVQDERVHHKIIK